VISRTAGALAVLGCLRPGQRLDVFGFNWNTDKSYFMHKMGAEGAIMARLLAAHGRDVTIHPTACDGLYSCERACDNPKYRLAADGDDAVCRAKARPPYLTLSRRCRARSEGPRPAFVAAAQPCVASGAADCVPRGARHAVPMRCTQGAAGRVRCWREVSLLTWCRGGAGAGEERRRAPRAGAAGRGRAPRLGGALAAGARRG